jgi:HsdM N-terminal domain
MPRTTKTKTAKGANSSTATIGFEAKLWLTADKLRNNMDAAEYKHVVLGLIFLKYMKLSRRWTAFFLRLKLQPVSTNSSNPC